MVVEINNLPTEMDFAETNCASVALAHNLRQKLQTLILLQDLLAAIVADERALRLVRQLAAATDELAGLLANFPCRHDAAALVSVETARVDLKSAFEHEASSQADLKPYSIMRKERATATVFVVDDDASVRSAICEVLNANGYLTEAFGDAFAFLKTYPVNQAGCILIDACMPEMDGFHLMQQLTTLPAPPNGIMMTGFGDVKMAVRAMRAGAIDFLEKPFGKHELLSSIRRGVDPVPDVGARSRRRVLAQEKMSTLTTRQRQVLDRVLLGQPSKIIAEQLSISQRTVDNHRSAIMNKTGVKSLSALLRVAVTATAD